MEKRTLLYIYIYDHDLFFTLVPQVKEINWKSKNEHTSAPSTGEGH